MPGRFFQVPGPVGLPLSEHVPIDDRLKNFTGTTGRGCAALTACSSSYNGQ